ncbi:hypothetical protein PV08_02703 [Exophiala spinifera]|uniref:Transcription factor domain-containing protein n=1 Tax=Exophiala spinifera TaxID=91928 RepID=A0A0D2BIK1_9EURO|nr:uncharacterized protein PV08_02703 [Exophiala spinifera]KIW18415.1 hypothetical protein PV08_02703 [Exophiala spinifera]
MDTQPADALQPPKLEHANGTGHGQPLVYRFVRQSGRKVDKSAHSAIRSHAMKGFRSTQRRQKQLDLVRRGRQPATEENLSICRCSPPAQQSPAPQEYGSRRQRLDTSSISSTSASERCNRCGKAQSLKMSPSEETNDLQQSSYPVVTFAAADFDPFNSITELPQSLTSKFSSEINAIKIHAVTFCFPGPIKTDVFPEALRTPALLASMLYMAYSYLRSVRGWSSPELALGLKVAAMSQINAKMSHPSTATCTNVIASIAYLSTGTWVFGNPIEEVDTHLRGMELMVKQRGMESLGVFQFGRTVRKYLFVQNLLLAAIQAQPAASTFDLDYGQSSNAESTVRLKHESPLYGRQGTFAELFQSKRLGRDTMYILFHAKALIDLVIGFDEGAIEEAEFAVTLHHIKTALERYKSTDDLQTTSEGKWVFKCCHLTVMLILNAIETAQPLISSDPALTLGLVGALGKTDFGDNWGELSGILYWVTMVGSASSQGRPGHRLLDSTLNRIMGEVVFTAADFGAAVEPIRQFSRLQSAIRRRSQAL